MTYLEGVGNTHFDMVKHAPTYCCQKTKKNSYVPNYVLQPSFPYPYRDGDLTVCSE